MTSPSERIARRAAELVTERLTERKREDPWLTSSQAAAHLGISLHALRHLVARRALPYSQERPGAKVYLRASDLDRWRREQSHDPR